MFLSSVVESIERGSLKAWNGRVKHEPPSNGQTASYRGHRGCAAIDAAYS